MPFAHYPDFEPDDDPPPDPGKMNGTVGGVGPKRPPADGLPHVWADDITLNLGRPGLIDGLLSSTAMTVLYGESGSGKTFVALDLGCHVAAGLPWRGMDVEQGVVVYVAAESPESVQRRVWAWKWHHGVERLPLVVTTGSVDLLNGSTDKVLAFIAQIRERHGRVALVVIDTLARAMTGNENQPDDMGRFVAACGRIREACEGHVLIVHHTGKDLAKGARGHSSLRAATDVELEVTNGQDGGCVRVTKHRDEAGGRSYGFRLETVELGVNDKGRTVTTCIAVACDPPDRATGREKRPLGPNEKIVFEALTAALSDHGQAAPPARDIPQNAKVVTVERWREAAFRYLPQAETKRKGEAFNRAMSSLVAYGRVRHVDGYAWLPEGRTGRTGSHEAPRDRATMPAVGSHGSRVSIDTRPCDHATASPEATEADRSRPGNEGVGDGGVEPAGSGPDTSAEAPVARPHATDATAEEPLVVADGPGGPQVTAVLADCYGSPFVCRGRLSRLRIDPTLNGLTPVRVLSLAIEGPGRRSDRFRSYRQEMPSPLMVLEGADVEVRVAGNPDRPRVLWHDEAAFRAVWEDVTRQAQATGRRIILDTVTEAVDHRDREAPRLRVENAAREAAMREFATDRGTAS